MTKIILACTLLLLISCAEEAIPTVDEVKVTVVNTSGDIIDGEHIEKHPNGNIKTKGVFKNGKRSGIWTSYFSNGSVQSENNYKKGVLNGKTAVYYPNGRVQYVGLYIDDQKDGNWFFYLEDGTLDKEILYKNGEKIKTTP